MNELLTKLGVSEKLQAYFQIDEPRFDFGNETEVFEEGYHFVPTTADLWTAGSYTASELIITDSAMEALAYMALNATRHPQLQALAFVALGNRPQREQFDWIRSSRQKRKITLVSGHDLTGRLADIVVAAGLVNWRVSLRLEGEEVILNAGSRVYRAAPEQLSLNGFEKATGIRTGIRTRKPSHHNTFLNQLLYDANL